MRRIALALAAAILGSGCIINADDTDPGQVEFTWRFRNYDGQVASDSGAANAGCGVAGVTDVYVEVYRGSGDGPLAFDDLVPCENAIAGVSLPEGTYTYWLTGYRLNDAVFDATGTFVVREALVTRVDDTLDVLANVPLTLYYTQNGTFSCVNTPSLYYAVYTNSARTFLVDSQEIPCDPGAFGFSLPQDLNVGATYYVDFMQLLSSGGISRYEACGVPVRHTGFPAILDLAPAPSASCGL